MEDRDLPAVQTAIDTHWRRGHILARDRELLQWQYASTNPDQRPTILIARLDGEIIALLGTIQRDIYLQGNARRAAWLALWFAAKQAPLGVGVSLLRRIMDEDFDVVACLGFNETAKRIYRSLRFSLLDGLPRWVRLVDRDACRELMRRNEAGKSYFQDKILSDKPNGTKSQMNSDRLIVANWSETTATAWEMAWLTRFSARFTGTTRNTRYLRWRYQQHPRFQYQLRFAQHSGTGEIQGLTVYRLETVRDLEHKVMRVVEFLGTAAGNQLLANDLIQAAESVGAAFIDLYAAGLSSESELALTQAGFFRETADSQPLPTLFQPLDFRRTAVPLAVHCRQSLLASTQPLDLNAWYVTRADGDQDRPN